MEFFPFEIVFVILFIIFSGLFSGFEISFLSLNLGNIKNLVKGKSEAFYLSYPRRVISTILIGNNFFNVGIAVLLTEFFYRNISEGFALELGGIVSFALILPFGEIVPKVFARYNPEFFFKTFHRFIYLQYQIFAPFITYIEKIIYKFISQFVQIESRHFSKKEIEMLSIIREKEGRIQKELGRSFRSFLKFSEKGIQEAIKSRTKLFALNYNLPVKEIKKQMCESGFTRVPIYEKTLDNIIGILHIKDVMYLKEKKDIKRFLRTPFFLPESAKLEEVFEIMRKEGTFFIIIVDEYGGTSGFVTMGDILSELFGESYPEKKISGSIILDAHTRIDDLEEKFFFTFPQGRYETIAGFILERTGRIPQKGERLKIDEYKIEILDANAKGLKTVKMETE